MPTSLGPAEILVILVVALIVLGPKRLPEAGRQVGKAIAEVRRWTTEVTTEIKSAVDIEVPAKSTVVAPVVVADTPTAVDTRPEIAPASAVVAPAAVAEAGPALVADHAEHEATSLSRRAVAERPSAESSEPNRGRPRRRRPSRRSPRPGIPPACRRVPSPSSRTIRGPTTTSATPVSACPSSATSPSSAGG